MKNEVYKIGELSKLVGLTTRTLRYYEELNLICSERSPGGQRLYDSNSLARLSIIESLKIAGFSLQDIRHILLDWKEKGAGKETAEKITRILRSKYREVARTVSALNTLKRQIKISIDLLDNCASCTETHDQDSCCNCDTPREYAKQNPLIDEILKS